MKEKQRSLISKEDIHLAITGALVLLAFYVITILISKGAVKWV
jgi:hypothetical protein